MTETIKIIFPEPFASAWRSMTDREREEIKDRVFGQMKYYVKKYGEMG